MLSGCQPGITKAAGILKRKVNTTDGQRTDRQNKQTNNKQQQKKTGTKCILIWENGSWLTLTANVNALSALPTNEGLLLSQSPVQTASWGIFPLGFYWGLPGGNGLQSGLALPGPCPAEIMYRLLGLQPVLEGPRPHNTVLWLPQDTMGLMLCPHVVRKGSVTRLSHL